MPAPAAGTDRRPPPPRPRLPRPPAATFHDAIDAGDFAEHVKTLSSDAFEGRGPGTPGEEKSVQYIKSQFARIGLKPGNNGDWFQTVPMVETTADPSHHAAPHRRRQAARAEDGRRHGHRHHQRQAGGHDQGQPAGVRRLRRRCARAALERLRRARREGQDRRHAGQRPRLPCQRRDAVRRQAHDLLRPLDLQVRGSRAPGRRRRADHP